MKILNLKEEHWDRKHRQDCRFVAEEVDEDGRTQVLGWAALSPVSERCVYEGVAEVSVYLDPVYQGRGIGKRLLEHLVEASEAAGIWTLQAGIFPENQASLALHKKQGFRQVGIRQRLGKLAGLWRDVVLLERRSSIAGQN